jgi:hypothetical protein
MMARRCSADATHVVTSMHLSTKRADARAQRMEFFDAGARGPSIALVG